MIWEVFRQERDGAAFAHAGSLEAADESFARAYAHELYGREPRLGPITASSRA